MATVQIDISVPADASESWWVGPISPAFTVDPNGIVCQNGANLAAIFMRFPGVAMPPGVVILNAWMRMTARGAAAGNDPRVRVKANDVDDAVAPTNFAESEVIRTGGQTTAFVDWTLPAWTDGDFGPAQQTPNLSAVVQEVVDRPGWASGNALMIVGVGLSTGGARAQGYYGIGGGGTIRFFAEYADPPAPPVPPPPIVPPGGTYGAAPGAPPGTILYITPDGIEYPLVTPHVTGRFVMSMSGFGTAPIQYISQRGPNQDGETVRDFNLTPRVIQVLERQQFKSRGTWWDGRADILNDLRPNRQATATAVVTGTFRIVTANGDIRDLNVFIQDGPRFEARNVDEWDEWAFEEVLRFIAHDPLWFNPTRVDLVLAFTLDANLVFPITFPIQFGEGLIDVSTNLDYTGTWASLPTIVITGPIDNPIIDNTTTGEKLELSRVIGPGRTVTIDLAFGQKTITDDLGNNLLGSLTTDSDLGTFHIAPTPEAPQVAGQPRPTARNVIRLRGSNPTGLTSVQFRYFTRYFGI